MVPLSIIVQEYEEDKVENHHGLMFAMKLVPWFFAPPLEMSARRWTVERKRGSSGESGGKVTWT